MEPPINILYKYLTEINKKYENTSFVDIDFIKLFSLKEKSNNLKKIITTKYYNLALKYHPDKHMNSNESVINIINCFINIEEIKSGQFLSFINDIHNMLLDILKDDPQILYNLIDGETEELLNQFDFNTDFNNLKRRFNKNIDKEYYTPNEEQINEFNCQINNEKITEIKLDPNEMKSLINLEQDKRNNLKIDNIFTEEEKQSENFKEIFNNKFYDIEIDESNTSIQPFNFNDNNLTLTGINNNISEIKEAFEPIKVKKKIGNILSYEQILEERNTQDKLFKIPIKKNI